MQRKKILFIFGTRPEAIKMAPIVHKFQSQSSFEIKVCVTGQHREMLDQVLNLFRIIPDFDLNIMKKNQSLSSICSDILYGLEDIFKIFTPDLIVVHGDTSTTFSASLTAFYNKIPVAHVEAGLRTNNLYSPWPEEGNRRLTGVLSSIHLSPTISSKNNLLREGVPESQIKVTGNSVIDSLFYVKNKIYTDVALKKNLDDYFHFLPADKRIILVTAHRRENHGEGFEVICQSLKKIAESFQDTVHIIYPVHLNPKVQEPVQKYLSNIKNVSLISPLDYPQFVYLMDKSYLILTDSGGVQEEAPSLGKPVLLLRDTTERPEAVAAGTVKLVGSNSVEFIIQTVTKLLMDDLEYQRMSHANNPYGDGKSSTYIYDFIFEKLMVKM